MNDDIQQIRAERREPSFYARIPKMAIIDLDPYELALYCNYKQTASDDGECTKSNATLATETGMSVTKVKLARKSLAAKGFIRLEHRLDEAGIENRTVLVTIADIWEINHQRFSRGGHEATTPGREVAGGGRVVTGGRARGDRGAVTTRPQRRTNEEKPEEPIKKTQSEEGLRARFRAWIQHGDKYADGALIDVVSPAFEDAANAIFWKWLEVLQEFRAKPDTELADLWEKNRTAIVGLVKHRRTPDQVEGYMRYAYTNPKDKFWREPLKPMNLTVVAGGIAAWLSRQSGQATEPNQSQAWEGDDNPFKEHERSKAELAAMSPEERAWVQAYHQLELQLDRHTFETWVQGAQLLRVDGDCYVIAVGNLYAQQMLETRLNYAVLRTFREFAGQQATLRFEAEKAEAV